MPLNQAKPYRVDEESISYVRVASEVRGKFYVENLELNNKTLN